MIVSYLAVMLLALLVGASELISRYRDEPLATITSVPAFLYLAINVAVAAGGLYAIDMFGWTFAANEKTPPEVTRFTQILVAAFGGMGLFRSSLFNVRVGETMLGIGPSAILQTLLDATDRAVDRNRAQPRARRVAEIMKDVDFDKAKELLPTFCLASMQNLPPLSKKRSAMRLKTWLTLKLRHKVKLYSWGYR